MIMPSKTSGAGGAAAAKGISFQAEVAAVFAAHAIAELPLQAIWIGASAVVGSITMEAQAPIDDVTICTHDGRRLYIQAKTTVSLSTANGGELASFADQAVRLFSGSVATGALTAHLFTPEADAILLAVSPSSPATVRLHLRQALDLARRGNDLVTARGTLNNDEQRAAYNALCKVIASVQTSAGPLGDTDTFTLLKSIHVAEFDTQGADKRAAIALLVGTLERPGDAEAAFDVLAHYAQKLMTERASADVKSLRAALLMANVALAAPPSFARDVAQVKSYSRRALSSLQAQQSLLSRGQEIKIPRDCIPDVRRAILTGHLLLLGEPGAGKTAVIAELASALSNVADVIVIAVEQLSGADLQGLCGDFAISKPVLDVLDYWPGVRPVVLCIDALDASRGGPTETAVQALIANIVAKLPDRFKVLASIRTFDLKMGTRYRSIFAGPAPVPALADPELLSVQHVVVPA